MSTPDYVIDEMISAKAIAARVEGLAREISAFFAGTDKLVVVGLLRGSFVFIADLVRELDMAVEVDFLEASSYGNATVSSREVRILKDLRGEIAGPRRAGGRGHRRHRAHAQARAGDPEHARTRSGSRSARCSTSRRGARWT